MILTYYYVLKDLFKNGFYDESNDSIHINYYIALNDVLKLNY